MNRSFALLGSVGLAAALITLGGCHASTDETTWTSSATQPKSVALVEMPGHETLWSMDIPAHHKLETTIDRGNTTAAKQTLVGSDQTPKEMHWALYNLESDEGEPVKEDTLELNGKPVRWSWSIREPGRQPRANLGGPEAMPEAEDEGTTQPDTQAQPES